MDQTSLGYLSFAQCDYVVRKVFANCLIEIELRTLRIGSVAVFMSDFLVDHSISAVFLSVGTNLSSVALLQLLEILNR